MTELGGRTWHGSGKRDPFNADPDQGADPGIFVYTFSTTGTFTTISIQLLLTRCLLRLLARKGSQHPWPSYKMVFHPQDVTEWKCSHWVMNSLKHWCYRSNRIINKKRPVLAQYLCRVD